MNWLLLMVVMAFVVSCVNAYIYFLKKDFILLLGWATNVIFWLALIVLGVAS